VSGLTARPAGIAVDVLRAYPLDRPGWQALALRLTRSVTAGPPPAAARVGMDFHGGSLRVGVWRVAGESVAYVRAGDPATLLEREVWEVPTSVYLPVAELPGLAAALGQAPHDTRNESGRPARLVEIFLTRRD